MAGDHAALLQNLVSASCDNSALSAELERAAFESTMRVLEARGADPKLRRLAVQALTNLADSEHRCRALHSDFPQLGELCATQVLREPSAKAAEGVLGLLTNLTRHLFWAEVIASLPKEKFSIDALLARPLEGWFSAAIPLVLNLTQVSSARRALCQADSMWVSSVVTWLEPRRPLQQRRLAAGVIKNVSFEDDCHPQLLHESCGLLPALLSLLVSSCSDPELEIDNDDLEELPEAVRAAVQDPKHEREGDVQLRLRILRTLLQLCSTPVGREALSDANTYVVLRELYKWEGEHGSREALVEARHVIDVLITEAEPKKEEVVPDYDSTACFRHVEVPEDQVAVVERLDEELRTG